MSEEKEQTYSDEVDQLLLIIEKAVDLDIDKLLSDIDDVGEEVRRECGYYPASSARSMLKVCTEHVRLMKEAVKYHREQFYSAIELTEKLEQE